jgi:hypothetical protein
MHNAFNPQGNTVSIAATTTATAAQQVNTGSHQCVRVAIQGSTQHVFVAFGATTATAALPSTAGASGNVVYPNTAVVFRTPPSPWISVITASGASTVWITPGYGG